MSNPLAELFLCRRMELGLAQDEVAEDCGLTGQDIDRIEDGRWEPELERLPLLADSLELAPAVVCRLALLVHAPNFYAALVDKSVDDEALANENPEDRVLTELRRADADWVRLLDAFDSEARNLLQELVEQLAHAARQRLQESAANN